MSDGDLDKSDPASPYKLEKAREKGSVAKSQDVSFLVLLFGLTCIVFGLGDALAKDIARVLHAALSQAARTQWDASAVSTLMGQITADLMAVLAPPSRMAARGLPSADLKTGIEATVEGYPSRDDPAEMRAERITIAGKTTELR